MGSTSASGSTTVYEFFDGTVPEDFDLQPNLYPGDLPLLGEDWHVTVEHLPVASPLAALLIDVGYSSRTPMVPVDLGIIGMPGCSLAVTPDATLNEVPAGGSATWIVPIDPTMGGLDGHVQCAAIAIGSNALGVVLTNVLIADFGY